VHAGYEIIPKKFAVSKNVVQSGSAEESARSVIICMPVVSSIVCGRQRRTPGKYGPLTLNASNPERRSLFPGLVRMLKYISLTSVWTVIIIYWLQLWSVQHGH